MFDNLYIDIAISLCFVFATTSLICTFIYETVVRLSNMRAKDLETKIKELIQDDDTRAEFLKHPLIKGLEVRRWPFWDAKKRVDSIPTRVFGMAMSQILLDKPDEENQEGVAGAPPKAPAAGLESIVTAAKEQVQADILQMRANLEVWFDSRMQIASAEFRDKAQYYMYIIAFFVAAILNLDCIHFAQRLFSERELAAKMAVVQSAKESGLSDHINLDESVAALSGVFSQAGMSVSWFDLNLVCEVQFGTFLDGFYTILGIVTTAFAAAAGAPVWFDAIQRLVGLKKSLAGEKTG